MNFPLINIITRCSRKDKFLNFHYPSIQNQTYRNFNHIITYENNDVKNFLLENTDPKITTLCKVFPTRKMEGVYRSFYYSQHGPYDDMDYINYKLWDESEEVTPYPNWEGGRFKLKHFPYNLYLIRAEKKVKEGWIIYLDDDDRLYDSYSLENLALKCKDEDTLYFFRNVASDKNIKEWGKWGHDNSDDDLLPLEYALKHVIDGTSPAMGVGIGGSTQTFHSKYLEYTAWDEWGGGDWRTVQSLCYNIPKREDLNLKIIQQGFPGNGEIN